VVDGHPGVARGGDPAPQRVATIDALIDRAVAAINRGDRVTANVLAGQVLAVERGNADAEDLLAAPGDVGEIRRLTILFADLVDSTVLSTRLEPEAYRSVVGRYREQVRRIVVRYEGHIGGTAGDGVLAVFGHPIAHEDDVRRAVRAGMEILAAVAAISAQARRQFGTGIDVRVGVHRGLVYLDTEQDDVYGLAANLAARVSGLAAPGCVALSEAVESLVRNDFDLERMPAAPVKGVAELISHYRVLGERVRRSHRVRGPLVGRERERDRIEQSWAKALSGMLDAPGLLFCGEPGIGKSRLAAEAADLAERSAGEVVEVAGSPYHADVGLHPVRALLERRCGISRATDPDERLRLLAAELAARGLDPAIALPMLAPVLAIGPEHGYQPVSAEGRRLEEMIAAAARSYLLACVGDSPGLLIAEDLQWFDTSTRELVGSMLDAGGGRLLVVLTSRDGDALPWQMERFELAPLTDDESDELVSALDPAVGDEQRAEVRRRCDGVPFHIEQVVAGLDITSPDSPHVPDALYEPLFARLRAGKNDVLVVEAAAVIGRNIDRALLRAVVDLDPAQVDEVIEQLTDAHVLEPWGGDNRRFRHELLREVASELAPPSVRRTLHSKVADALVDTAAGDPDWPLIAAHYERSARHADAATAYQQASGAARGRGALAEARTYLSRALTQVELCPPGPDRDRREIAPRLKRGYLTATAEGAQSPVAVADFERCLELVGTDLRDDEVVATLTAVGAYYLWRADLQRVGQVIAVAQAGIEGARPWFRPAVDGSAGIIAWLRGEFDTARAYFGRAITDRAVEYERRLQDLWFVPHDPVALAHEHLAWDRLVHGDLAGAEEQLTRARGRADKLGYPQRSYNDLYAIDMEIWVRTEAGQFDHARALVAELVEKSDRYGLDYLYWQLLGQTELAMVEGRALLASRDLDSAAVAVQLHSLTQAVEVWRALGAATYRPFYWCVLGQLLAATGARDQARARLDAALQFTADSGVRFYDAELLRTRAHTCADPDARAAGLAAARDLARRQGAWLFQLRASLDDFELRGEPARSHLIDALAEMTVDSALPEVSRARAALR
jgi:class 3 adenylate cyclase/tetratricopeptide (TPR) repeat protein